MAVSRGSNFDPPKLDLSVDRYCAFKTWHERWTDYSVVTKLKDESAEYQSSTLRYTFSEETRKIYLTNNEKKDPAVIIKKLEEFSKGIINESIEHHTFNS